MKKGMHERQILAVIKEDGEKPRVEPLFDNTLEAFQEAVGGYIETVTLATDLVLIVNEEGRLLDLPHNVTVCGIPSRRGCFCSNALAGSVTLLQISPKLTSDKLQTYYR